MRGRKPLPTKIKLLQGTVKKNRLSPAEPEGTPLESCPRPPKMLLGKQAKEEWKRVAPLLFGAGLLATEDMMMLICYCSAVQELHDAMITCRDEGTTIISRGNQVQHPAMLIASRARRDIKAFAVEFGMTPSSRSRMDLGKIKLSEAEGKPTGLRALLQGGKTG